LKIGFFSFIDNSLNDKDQFITFDSLKKISKELQEEISDEELKEMIIEANPELRPLYNECVRLYINLFLFFLN